MARAMLIACSRNFRRWEDGHHPVSGPARVEVKHLLQDLAAQVAEIIE
jgi:hypothetical protein